MSMGVLDRLDKSADLVMGMAQRVGHDVHDALIASPHTSGASFAAMVYRCSSCTEQDTCAALQHDHEQLESPPEYCRNRQVFGR
jgi:hypothetical protein